MSQFSPRCTQFNNHTHHIPSADRSMHLPPCEVSLPLARSYTECGQSTNTSSFPHYLQVQSFRVKLTCPHSSDGRVSARYAGRPGLGSRCNNLVIFILKPFFLSWAPASRLGKLYPMSQHSPGCTQFKPLTHILFFTNLCSYYKPNILYTYKLQ